jgi:hypothetical protein
MSQTRLTVEKACTIMYTATHSVQKACTIIHAIGRNWHELWRSTTINEKYPHDPIPHEPVRSFSKCLP